MPMFEVLHSDSTIYLSHRALIHAVTGSKPRELQDTVVVFRQDSESHRDGSLCFIACVGLIRSMDRINGYMMDIK